MSFAIAILFRELRGQVSKERFAVGGLHVQRTTYCSTWNHALRSRLSYRAWSRTGHSTLLLSLSPVALVLMSWAAQSMPFRIHGDISRAFLKTICNICAQIVNFAGRQETPSANESLREEGLKYRSVIDSPVSRATMRHDRRLRVLLQMPGHCLPLKVKALIAASLSVSSPPPDDHNEIRRRPHMSLRGDTPSCMHHEVSEPTP